MTTEKDTTGVREDEQSSFARFQLPKAVLLLLVMSASAAGGFIGMLHYLDAPPTPQRAALTREEFFNAGASGVKVLGSGWFQPEQWGTWSDGSRAILNWKLDIEPLGSLHLKVEGRAFPFQSEQSQTIDVEVNGTRVGTMQSSVDGKLRNNSIEFSRRVAMQSAPMKIVFLIARPTSPEETKAGGDKRKIGLGLASASLRY